ncbi:MAG: Spy/CpxP family protein refolding chaperone [Syntrophales bacterium]|nr:Spy/CpxP family protein refolding chaperone [Syntrophales bacterium]MDD5233992.1 Spy/CpxP family protein refolding chaperone [Syntrophales bacterium]
MKRIVFLIISFVIAVSFTTAFAGPVVGTKGNGWNIASLNLTTDQANKIQTLREARWKEIKPLRNKLFNRFTELKLLWMQANPDQAKIKTKQQEIRDIQSRLQDKLTTHRLEIRKILTPEQQAQITAFGLERGYYRGFSKASYHGKKGGEDHLNE